MTLDTQIVETTEVRRCNRECEYGEWIPLADDGVPANVREAVVDSVIEAICRDMKGLDPLENTDERGMVLVGGARWAYKTII